MHWTAEKLSDRRKRLPAYYLYGLCIRSQWPLPSPEGTEARVAEVELVEASSSLASAATQGSPIQPNTPEWFHHARLRDGSTYLRWSGLFEFLVSADGSRITGRALAELSREVFHTYLLGQVLSFALVKRGIEPLHSTAVVVDGEAVGFVGDCGYGKSSLGAAFLRAGHPLLTDDLLVVKPKGRRFIAYPGPPRIKLFPEIARSLLGDLGTGAPMNPQTSKLVIPVPPGMSVRAARPLRVIYVLRPPTPSIRGGRITIRSLPQRRACLELIANTFNPVVVERNRLRRQFGLAARLAAGVPLKSLSYPRDLSRLPDVLEAVRTDLSR